MKRPRPERPLLCAHRGARKVAPENTLPAFEAAARQGAEATELDVQLSRDGVPVVIHNFTVDATSNGRGKVGALSFAQLRELDFGAWFAPEFAGTRIPTLDEVFDLADRRLLVNVELKTVSVRDEGLARAAADLFRKRNLYERAMVSSFNPFTLVRVRRLDPRIECGLICDSHFPLSSACWLRPLVRPDAMHPEHRRVDAAYIGWARARGYAVNVWTVNEEADMRRMLALGVDTIMTDVPERLAAVMAT